MLEKINHLKGKELSLHDFCKTINYEGNLSVIPSLKVAIDAVEQEGSEKTFKLDVRIIADNAQGNLKLIIGLSDNSTMAIHYHADSEEPLTLGVFIQSILPIQADNHRNHIFGQLYQSQLNVLKLYIDSRSGFSFYSSGKAFGMAGELGFCFNMPEDGSAPQIAFNLLGAKTNTPKSVAELLSETVGLSSTSIDLSWLPPVQFLLAELSFDQTEGKITFGGQLHYSKNNRSFSLDGRVELLWLDEFYLKLYLDAIHDPLNLALVLESLSIPPIKLPLASEEEIQFYLLDFEFDKRDRSISFQSISGLWETVAGASVRLFEQDGLQHLQLQTHIGRIGLITLIDKLGASRLPNTFPDLMLQNLYLDIDTVSETIRFSGAGYAEFLLPSGTAVKLDMTLASSYSKSNNTLSGKFDGSVMFAGMELCGILDLTEQKKLIIQQPPIVDNTQAISLHELLVSATGESIVLPEGVPDCLVERLNGEVDFTSQELAFSGECSFSWNLIGIQQPINVAAKLDLKRQIDPKTGKFAHDIKLAVFSTTTVPVADQVYISDFQLSYEYQAGDWELKGFVDATVLNSSLQLSAALQKDQTKTVLLLNTNAETNIAASQLLLLAGENELYFPQELNNLDLSVAGFELSLDSQNNFSCVGQVSLGNAQQKPAIEIGDESLALAQFDFDLFKGQDETTICFHLKGWNLPKVASLDASISAYELSFETTIRQASKPDWQLKGALFLEAFHRLAAFKAEACYLAGNQQILFSFESSEPILYAGYFMGIEGANPVDVMKALNGGRVPENKQIVLANLRDDALSNLDGQFTSLQKEAIAKVLEDAKRCNDPLLSIPDILNENKPLCTISPRQFVLQLARENGRFKSIDFAISSDLTIYNTWADQTKLFHIENGIVSSGYDQPKKQFYLTFSADQAQIKPLSAIGILPGVMDALILAFGETNDCHPKATAFVNMLEIQPQGFSFMQKDKDWQLAGSIRLALNDGLQAIDKNLYGFLEKLFPKTGDVRYLEGQLSYDSKEGLIFVLKNNNGLEIPNFLAMAATALDPQFKADFKLKTGVDLNQALDLGSSFVILDRVRLKIAKEAELDMRIGLGIPANLNDRLFNPSSKIHGLVNTYNRDKFIRASKSVQTGKVEYNEKLPDDNLIRATLKIGSEGISGQLDRFNLFNLDKIGEEFKGLITEDSEHVTIDLNAIAKDGKHQYGKLKLGKFVFKLDFKTCAFTVGGDIEVLSDTLRIPVRPLMKKFIAILPTDKFDTITLNSFADHFADSILINSIDFYDASSGKLHLNELQEFLKQFLLEEHKNRDILPAELLKFLNENSQAVTKLLPELLLEYLSIKIPVGLKFQLEVTADQSVSFALEVPTPTEAQKAAGYSEYLQVLFSDFMFIHGMRLKKLGIGSGLFNQAIRLDLSAEWTGFRYLDIIAGAGLSVLRNSNPDDARLQHMVPDVRSFGYNYKIDNLLLLVFPQTYVPIPVPVFYENFSVYCAGLEGGKFDLAINFPRPKLNIAEAFTGLGDLANFFKNKDIALPIDSYGTIRTVEDIPQDSMVPAFRAGPVYVELPGILGYQKLQDGTKEHIRIGFKDVKVLNPKDLVALAVNTVKTTVRSITEKQAYRIKIDDNRSEYPLNYLIQFLPETQRIGTSALVLFDVLEADFAWALSTPGEFGNKLFPLLIEEQRKSLALNNGGDQTGRELQPFNSAGELLAIIPQSEHWHNDQEGVVLFFKGSAKISDQVYIDAATATALTASNGIASGVFIRSRLAKIFDMQLSGAIKIDKDSPETMFGLAGKSSLTVLDNIPVMKGGFSMGVGPQSHLMFNGLFDLFPDELFNGNRSPIQLYTGTGKATKSEITGILDRNGIIAGRFNTDGSISAAGIHLEIGDFYLAGTTRIISTAERQEWELTLVCYDTQLALNADFFPVENGSEMRFGINANNTIGIENLLTVSGTEPGTGAAGKLILTYSQQNPAPVFTECYLDGAVSLLGLSSSTRLYFNPDGFAAEVKTDLGIIRSALRVVGKNFNDVSCFELSGSIGLLNDVCKVDIDAAYYQTNEKSVFKGGGYFEFWGAKQMDLQLEAGTDGNAPLFRAEGILDLSLPNGIVRLYTGTADGPSNITGIIDKDKLELTGGLQFELAGLRAGGSATVKLDAVQGFTIGGRLAFNTGLLTGGDLDISIAENGNLLELSGTSLAGIQLIPGIFELGGQSRIDVHIDQQANTLALFKLSGASNIFATSSNYDIDIRTDSFTYTSIVNTPVVDLSLTARSEDISSVESLKLSGKLDVAKLNTEIDKFYEAIGIRGKLNDKIQAIYNGKSALQGTQQEMLYKQERIDFIQHMDSVWTKNGIDPDGFQYCVPPVGHVEYWSESRWQWNFGNARYSKSELEDVKKYYQYKRDLGLPADEPGRHDIGRFVNGTLQAVNNLVYAISQDISAQFRQIVNDLHRIVSEDILRNLNIDSTDLNYLNSVFNQGLTRLDAEAAKWHDLNNKLLNYKLLEVNEVTFTDQSIDFLRTGKFTSSVKLTVLGDQQPAVELMLDINDPVRGLSAYAGQLLPAELRVLVG
jgi:hypothetical protein